jgi:hypothetical protein
MNLWLIVSVFSQNNFSSYGDNKEDYSDLPPNQRKKKLQLRVEDIAAKIQQETAARFVVRNMWKEFAVGSRVVKRISFSSISIYGSQSVVFTIEQNTFLQSNFTQVYLIN